MIRTIITPLILLLALPCHAQFVKRFGIKSGVSFASQSWPQELHLSPNPSHKDYRTGLYLAGTACFIDKQYWGVSLDAGFIRKGDKEIITTRRAGPTEDPRPISKEVFHVDYLTVNPLVNASLPITRKLKVSLFAGPRADFLLSTGQGLFNLPAGTMVSKSCVFGLTYGIGAQYRIGRHIGISAEAQYQHDITNYYLLAHLLDQFTQLGYKNNALVFNAGIHYWLKPLKTRVHYDMF